MVVSERRVGLPHPEAVSCITTHCVKFLQCVTYEVRKKRKQHRGNTNRREADMATKTATKSVSKSSSKKSGAKKSATTDAHLTSYLTTVIDSAKGIVDDLLDTAGDVEKTARERVGEARDRIVPDGDDIDALRNKVRNLTDQVEKLARVRKGK